MKRWLSKLPPMGARMWKTIFAATLVAFVYSLIDRNACFACIGAVYGMGSVRKNGLVSGGNRFIGTLIGGVVAIFFYWLIHLTKLPVPDWALLAVGLGIVLYTSAVCGAHGAIQPGTVVFFVVLYTVAKEQYLSYTIARILDTGIGVLVSYIISLLWPSPYEKKQPEQAVAPAGVMSENS
ncbi:MAG: aromatic acid exporter family protein [Pygmaiobacter massiliensis]|nr:aromatic acid exporter family protein [Pygmaiobacter massiliensis]